MALALLHSHGLFHAHVTPARIMFGSPGRNEAGAATARLCYLEKPVTPGDTWQAGEPRSAGIEKDLRDSDIVSLGLTAFAALMGDAGAAAGEPLESYRATTESTGVPELSPLGREAIDLMLGTDPTEPIPSAAELLQHSWFPVDGVENQNAVAPMPLAPGQKVAIGPPARPENVPVGLPPMVPKLSANNGHNGAGASVKGSGQKKGAGEKDVPWVEMPDGSQALSAWLVRKSSTRNALGMKSAWQRRWFVLNPSTSMLLIYTHEVDLTLNEAESTRRSSGSIPKAYPLDCARISELARPSVKDTPSTHEYCLVLEDTAERFPSMFLSFPDPTVMGLWSNTFRSVREVRAAGTRARKPDVPARVGGLAAGGDDGVDWWDDVSHQAQRVAHVTAASAFAAGGGEAELSRFVEEKLLMHKRSAKSMCLNGSIKSGGTSLFGGGGSMVLPTSNNAGTIFKNSALQWERRVEELASVTAGKPINSAMLPGERWFIVDARWMDHWLEFCTSKRRMAPPGPVDNSWMLHSDKRHVPYDGLTLALGKQAGDYRRVGPECWDQLMRLYGGGPAIHVDGPPVEDLTRWVVRFGHQVSAQSGRRSARHIPNPNVSVKNLKQAANQWVGGWDEEDDEDYESAEDDTEGDRMSPALGQSPSSGMTHAGTKGPGGSELRGSFGSLATPLGATPLGVLREEDGMGDDRSGDGPTNRAGY